MLKPPYQLLAIKQDQSHLNAIANMFSLRSQLEGKQGPYQLHNGSTNQDGKMKDLNWVKESKEVKVNTMNKASKNTSCHES